MTRCHTARDSLKWGTLFDVASAKSEIAALEETSASPDFWNDSENSHKVLQRLKGLQKRVHDFEALNAEYDDLIALIELGFEENDDSVYAEGAQMLHAFIKKYDKMRIATLLNGEYDRNNAMVTLHSGAGGTESCDWVSMLMRMYTRWAEKHGFTVEILDYIPGDEAGTKSVVLHISGENAYGYMQGEHGVHRLVRISPFDSSGRRHTSFASCSILPELDDDVEVDINPEDLRIDTYRASGAGGQHVNKTESAIRITHIPTHTVVQCQNERSQLRNRERAMVMLRAKLHEIFLAQQQEKKHGLRGEIKDVSFGSQIRNYVFHPYSLAKDLRTGEETGNISAVMDGDLDAFINAYLVAKSSGRIQE